MSWNHRVVHIVFEVDDKVISEDLAVCEVYYDRDGNPNGFDSTPFLRGDTIDEIRETLKQINECLDKPILERTASSLFPPRHIDID